MKSKMKFYPLFFISTLLSVFTSAQTFNGGFYSGLITSQVDGDKFSGFHKAGLVAAGLINMDINRKWLAQLEVRYIQKGSQKNTDTEKGDYSYYKMKVDYAEVPLLLSYQYNREISIEIGPAIAYMVNNIEEYENGTLRNRPAFNKLELSGLVGFTYEFKNRMFFNARYQYSMFPIRGSIANSTYYVKGGQYNNLLSFTLGYYFFSKTI